MPSSSGVRLLAALVPAALLLPTAAHAEKVVTDDPAADAVRVVGAPVDGGGEDQILPAPENTTADVVSTVVDHDEARVRVTVRLRELGSARMYFAVLQVRTPDGSYEVEVERLGREPRVEMTRRGRAVDCARLRASSDRSRARVVVTVPAACLGSPRWVQLGVGVASLETEQTDTGTEEVVVFADDAHRAGTIRTDRLTRGPRVHRG